MISALGYDKALQLAKDLGNNPPRLGESHTQSLTQMQSGEPRDRHGLRVQVLEIQEEDA